MKIFLLVQELAADISLPEWWAENLPLSPSLVTGYDGRKAIDLLKDEIRYTVVQL